MTHVFNKPERPMSSPRVFGDIFRGSKVLITGHTGFKGSWLTSWLLRRGAEVYGYSKDIPTTPSLFALAGLENRIDHRIGDIRDLPLLQDAILSFRPDFLFHLAAQALVSVSYLNSVDTITSNVVGTTHVLEALRGVEWPCVAVIITSDKCYDNVESVWGYRETDALGGKDVYSGSKGAAELVIKSYIHSFFRKPDCPVKLAVARAGNVIGGGDWAADRIIADCIRAWVEGRRVLLRNPAATRPWQHVLEPLSGYLTLAEQMARTGCGMNEPYNFGPHAEQNRTVMQVLTELSRIWGFETAGDAFAVIDNVPFHEAGLLKLNCDKALLQLSWEANLSYVECMHMTGLWYRRVLRDGDSAANLTDEQIHDYETIARERGRVWAGATN